MVGWEVYTSFYFPNWVLVMLAIVIVAMPIVALFTLRARAARLRAEGGAA